MSGGSEDPFSASDKTSGPDMSYGYGATSAPPVYDNPNYSYQAGGVAQPNVLVHPSAGVTQSLSESGRVIQTVQQFGGNVDDEDDVFSTKGHVKVTFDEIFNEPQNVTSFGPIKTVNSVVFEYTQSWIYKIFSAGLGVILASVWGLAFGLFHFFIIWFAHPWLKLTFMALRLFGLAIKATVRTCIDPCFISMGLSLSSIVGKFNLKLFGIPEPKAHSPRVENAIQNA